MKLRTPISLRLLYKFQSPSPTLTPDPSPRQTIGSPNGALGVQQARSVDQRHASFHPARLDARSRLLVAQHVADCSARPARRRLAQVRRRHRPEARSEVERSSHQFWSLAKAIHRLPLGDPSADAMRMDEGLAT